MKYLMYSQGIKIKKDRPFDQVSKLDNVRDVLYYTALPYQKYFGNKKKWSKKK